jgi:DNA-binding transcriptional LysR family regulator
MAMAGPTDVHLRDLRYFVAVAEELNFTRAAQRLFIAQPSLSKQIRLLERDLGVLLFDRTPKGVRLTEAGASLLESAVPLLASWRGSTQRLAELVAAERSELVVGFHTSVGRNLLRTVSQRFASIHPGWAVSLRLVTWADPTAGLTDHQSDVALLWRPIPDDGALSIEVLYREPRWIALWDDHPLAGRSSIDFSELLDEPFIALPEDSGPLRGFWLGLDARGGRNAVVGAVAASPDEAFDAVANGRGVAVLAEGNAAIYRRPGVTTVALTGLAPSELVIAWATGDRRAQVDDFVRLCIEVAGEPAEL